ncbi:hypothetical protein CMI37_12340 [Candidatus Pacearchaeota archaeon]|nr:hypothetical protein [Candidatus Pacearchaeota archaeon]|tara:strand:- start:2906 stop:4828 length:1923 start_codon:yes stop_codon:yes gene_type:complete
MWSLFKKKEDEDSIIGGLSDYTPESGEELTPLIFSNQKSQADIVKEILDEIEKGNKIIFIRGVCGTGKSAIALNLARHFKKTSIVVPIKSLQEQYEYDYTKKNFLLKKDKKKLDIAIIKGRNNFNCPFLGGNADADDLPCTIELRDKNTEKIKKYIEQNPSVEKTDFSNVSDVRRMSIAPACPHWSPLLPSEVSSQPLKEAKKIKYKAVCGKEFALFQRKKGCSYFDQYESYANADVLIFNSSKYLIECAIGRKPTTDLEIIDECDEFLDSFANERKINLNRLVMALSNLFPENREQKQAIKDIIFLTNEIILTTQEDQAEIQNKVQKIKQTKILDLINKVISEPYLAENEENNYYNNILEIAKSFEHLLDETYISLEIINPDEQQHTLFTQTFSKEKTTLVNIVSINLAQKLKEIIEANNILVLMSGTLHSEKVLKDIFGLEDFKVIEAETQMPGTITKYRTGLEKNCKYANFQNNSVTREDYLKALSTCVANASPPSLIHVNSFKDLPAKSEIEKFQINNLITQEELRQLQQQDKLNKRVDKFKKKETDILFTTKCSRGVDFPGDKCNSIILTKYPYPNIQGLFWKILKQEQPEKFMEFYLDKAHRELIQKIARGIRFKGDHVLLLSPDVRVLNARLN